MRLRSRERGGRLIPTPIGRRYGPSETNAAAQTSCTLRPKSVGRETIRPLGSISRSRATLEPRVTDRERPHGLAYGRSAAVYKTVLAVGVAGSLAVSCVSPGLSRRYQSSRNELSASTESVAMDAEDDALFGDRSSIDAATLVREVLRRNPALRAAHQAWRAALARYPQEAALEDPIAIFGAAPRTFGRSTGDSSYMVELHQPLPFPGKRGLRGERALAEADASAMDLDAIRLDLAVRVQVLFSDYYLTVRALEINATHVRLLEDLHQSALTQYEVGLVSQQDPLQAETQRLGLVQREIELRSRLRMRVQQLNALLHRGADLPLPAPAARTTSQTLSDDALTEAIDKTIQTRPEIAAADASIAARESAKSLARLEFLPDFELWGKYDRYWTENDRRPSVGVAVNIPLQLERRRGAVDEADAELERARRERDRLADEIRSAVATAAERVREQNRLQELLLTQTLPAVRDRVVAARAAYDTGKTTFIAVVDAFREQLEAELAYQTAVAMYARRQAEFFGAAGDINALQAGGPR